MNLKSMINKSWEKGSICYMCNKIKWNGDTSSSSDECEPSVWCLDLFWAVWCFLAVSFLLLSCETSDFYNVSIYIFHIAMNGQNNAEIPIILSWDYLCGGMGLWCCRCRLICLRFATILCSTLLLSKAMLLLFMSHECQKFRCFGVALITTIYFWITHPFL